MYIPLSIPRPPLPPYIHLDRGSLWHTSALLSMAWESVTLPSRLRPDHAKRGVMDDMVAALNVSGSQRMASLQCSLLESNQDKGSDAVLSRASNDQRMPRSNTSNMVLAQQDTQKANASFDVDLSGRDISSSALLPIRNQAEDHIFGRVEVIRDKAESNGKSHDDKKDDIALKRRRLAAGPVVERSVLFTVESTAHRGIYSCELQHF